MHFGSLDKGVEFYRDYGKLCGFDIRISTSRKFKNKEIRLQYIVCNREGYKQTSSVVGVEGSNSHTKQRTRVSNRCGCNAHCVLEYTTNGAYAIKNFEERHTHSFNSESYRHFLKVNRNLNFGHKQFIINCSKANIGSSKTHHLFRQMVGGFSQTGALPIDFKNFKRDLKAYIRGADAQLIIDRFLKKKEMCPGMAFSYDVGEQDQLTRLFWADPISVRNYAMFGDVISFDATYNTNRYKMVFAPFTGIDNHRQCVTFACGLLLKEDEESYVWLFRQFLDTMGKESYYIVTDQDPTMKNAFQIVFKTARHRLCMWHIMEKVSTKVGHALFKTEEFLRRLNATVWDEKHKPVEFEKLWHSVMTDFELENHPWFTKIFEIRESWIPAYFRDVPMGGLMRTTSRSESTNSWFGGFTNPQVNLVEFFMHFDSAVESQRHAVHKLNNDSDILIPQCKIPLGIEKHASTLYTHAIFKKISLEIANACYKCSVHMVNRSGGSSCSYSIKDEFDDVFKVQYCKEKTVAVCNCKMFEMHGILCQHIFVVFKDLNEIPRKYVPNRWMRLSSIHPSTTSGQLYEFNGGQEAATTLNELWSTFHNCIRLANGKVEKLADLARLLSEHKNKLAHEQDGQHDGALRNSLRITAALLLKWRSQYCHHNKLVTRAAGAGLRADYKAKGKRQSVQARN